MFNGFIFATAAEEESDVEILINAPIFDLMKIFRYYETNRQFNYDRSTYLNNL